MTAPEYSENLFPTMPEQEWFDLRAALEAEIAMAWVNDGAMCKHGHTPTRTRRAAATVLKELEFRGEVSPPHFEPEGEHDEH